MYCVVSTFTSPNKRVRIRLHRGWVRVGRVRGHQETGRSRAQVRINLQLMTLCHEKEKLAKVAQNFCRVLLVEAGGPSSWFNGIPAAVAYYVDSDYDWKYSLEPSDKVRPLERNGRNFSLICFFSSSAGWEGDHWWENQEAKRKGPRREQHAELDDSRQGTLGRLRRVGEAGKQRMELQVKKIHSIVQLYCTVEWYLCKKQSIFSFTEMSYPTSKNSKTLWARWRTRKSTTGLEDLSGLCPHPAHRYPQPSCSIVTIYCKTWHLGLFCSSP